MQNKLPISVVIVCLNEEEHIARCINSVQAWVDEVIVVDTGSDDDTLEIVEKLGIQTQSLNWLGFGATKNLSHQFARNRWILSLDADEEVDHQLRQAIAQLDFDTDTIYGFNRRLFYEGQWIKYGKWYPDRVVRLFPKKMAKWNDAQVHEKLIHDLQYKHLLGHLNHYSYTSIEDQKQRIDHYSRLKAQQWIANNTPPSIWKRVFGIPFHVIKNYIFKQGFRHGRIGWQLAKMDAYQVRRELHHYDELSSQ